MNTLFRLKRKYAAIAAVVFCLTPALMAAPTDSLHSRLSSLGIRSLNIAQVGEILIVRGKTTDPAVVGIAREVATSMGHRRVANLVQFVATPDDGAIARAVERQLSLTRSLEGTRLSVDSNEGVVRVAGTVQSELQKDLARMVALDVDGVRSVTLAVNR